MSPASFPLLRSLYLLTIVIFLTGFSKDLQAQTVLDAFTLSSSVVNVSPNGATVTAEMWLRNTPDSLFWVFIYVGDPDGETQATGIAELIEGTKFNGKWKAQFFLLSNTPAGTYPVYIQTFDASFDMTKINTGKTIQVTGGDSEPPALAGEVTLFPTSLDVSSGSKLDTVTIPISDNFSGVIYVRAEFRDSQEKLVASGYATLISGDNMNGVWKSYVEIPQNASGVLHLVIYAMDNAGNYTELPTGKTLTVGGGDILPPVFVSPATISPASVNVSAGDQTVTVTVNVTDDFTKVEDVYVNFYDSEESYVSGSSADLISGDSLNGQWRAEVVIPQETVEGTLRLEVSANDRAGNYMDTLTTSTLQVTRVPEAVVTFRLDLRNLMRLGIVKEYGSVYVEVFDGPNAGSYYMQDDNNDSIWTYEKIMVPQQNIKYAFAVQNGSPMVYELNGSAGGRILNIPAPAPMTLPVVSFDNIPLMNVDQNYAAQVAMGFYPGNPYPYTFNLSNTSTYATIDFVNLDKGAIVGVRRFSKAPGGGMPSGIVTMASNIFWAVDKVPAALTFDGKLSFEYNLFGGVTEPSALRLLRREDRNQPWVIAATELNTDDQTLTANVTNGFSEWTIGSVSAANTLQPQVPGLVSNPIPVNGASNVNRNPEFRWTAASGGRTYDFYFWKSSDPVPSVPVARDLRTTSFRRYDLEFNTSYSWRVVAKNILDSTAGPVWTFSTQSTADLIVDQIMIPPSGFSGKDFDVQWTVKNIGNSVTNPGSWYDVIYLSVDSLLEPRGDIRLGSFDNMNPLNPGESYINNKIVKLPDGVFDKYYIIITANYFGNVPETNDSNNTAIKSFNISLTPPPDLQVVSMLAPEASFSGQEIDVTYSVKNLGANATQTARWYDAIYISSDSIFTSQNAKRLQVLLYNEVLLPDSGYTRNTSVKLPDGISGKYFLFVLTDYDNRVFEHALESNNMRQRSIQVTLSPPPDLTVTSITIPAAANSGTSAVISWKVQNQGLGTALGSWRDRVFISKVTPFDSAQSIFVKEVSKYRELAVDSSYTENTELMLPNGISGDYYFYVETDWKNQLFEYTFENNNMLVSTSRTRVTLSPWADLLPVITQRPDNATASEIVNISYRMENKGQAGISSGQWLDSLYISAEPQWDRSRAEGIASGFFSAPLSAGASYNKTVSAKIPRRYTAGTYYIYIAADIMNTVFEHTDEANNIVRSAPINIKAYPPVDLIVDQLSVPAAGGSGQQFNFQFSVKNTGTGTTPASSWTDVVYLSSDTSLNAFDDMFITRIQRSEPLSGGASYNRSVTANLPNGISGNYYLLVKCDSANQVEDLNPLNNLRYSAQRINITLTPSADLQILTAQIPSDGQAGQPVSIKYNVKNAGANITSSISWNDAVYLSNDVTLDQRDATLASFSKNGPLAGNGTYETNTEIVLPTYLSGDYYLIIKADSRDELYEHNAESNNLYVFPITVTLPPPSDLIVTDVTVPASAVAGKSVSVSWTINNKGINPANGRMSDAVYFSSDQEWDLSDPLLGIVLREINLNPGGSQTASFEINPMRISLADSTGEITANLPGLLTGEYYVIIRTNLKNNIRESDYSNNMKSSSGRVNVDVITLPLSTTVRDTVTRQGQTYYKVNVPEGVDLRITAVGSSNVPTIDIYTAFGKIPTTSDYDYRTEDPLPVNREVFVPSTKAGTYFITLRSNNSFFDEQYNIIAEALSFSVTGITPAKGGMGGQVTTRITGAGFRDSTRFYLYKSGNMVTEGTVRKFNSTMDVTVRWNLKNVQLGVYDVVAVNKNGASADTLDAFTVEPAREMNIAIGQSSPNVLLYGRKEAYTLRFTNTSNVDIPYAVLLIHVPNGTEADLKTSPRIITRKAFIPDSLKLEEGAYEDYTSTQDYQLFPMLVRDLTPGEAVDCRISFRNPGYGAGSSFPMSVGARSLDKDAYIAVQLSMIESSRQSVLVNQTLFPPEVVASAFSPESFAKFMLDGYVQLGLLDRTDMPSTANMSELLAKSSYTEPFTYAGGQGLNDCSAVADAVSRCEEFFNIIGCFAAVADCFIPFPPIPPPFNFIMCGFGIAASCGPWDAGLAGCIGVASGLTCLAKELICKNLVASLDPNDIIGPEGYGDKKWVALNATLGYQIRFENDPKKATAPAQRVVITQQLDSTVDLRSFRLGAFGFANQTYEIPGNPAFYSTRLDLRDSLGIYVDVVAGIDITTGRISWNFKSIDPATGDIPNNPFAGLLPVNDSTGRGNGFVRYSVKPKQTSSTGDIINAKAKIIFDQNDPLDTPPIANTIDAVSPTSKVRSLSKVSALTFPVRWGGSDDSTGSVLKTYSVYVSVNDSQYTAWKTNTTDTTAMFTGIDGSKYKFLCLSADNAGNSEPAKMTEDASTLASQSGGGQDEIPTTYVIEQNYPNPFNPGTKIKFGIPEKANVQLKIYDILGREVVTLIDGPMEAGWYIREFNGSRFASGVYIYRIEAGNFRTAKKMILLK